jgi:hypothetical protein
MPSENIHPPEHVAPLIISYAPPSLKPRLSLPHYIAMSVLAIGTIGYAIACSPAYGRSPWPPLDRFFEGLPWLWIFPIPMFTLLIPGGRFSRTLLTVYALFTSLIDAWTFPFASMNPHPSFDVGLWVMNLPETVALHFGVTAVVALWSRLAYYFLRLSARSEISPQSRWYRWARIALLAGILAVAAIFPFGYRSARVSADEAEGAKIADADWAAQKASVISGQLDSYRPVGEFDFLSYFDADSGLPFERSWAQRWEPGYNAEIHHLLNTRGIPPWSHKSRFVSDADMIAMLTSLDLKEVTNFPDNLSPNLVLFRGGGITPWGVNVGSNSNDLTIATRNQEFLPVSPWEENDPAFVGRSPKYPGTFFVRCGKSVVACTADGWLVQYVWDTK